MPPADPIRPAVNPPELSLLQAGDRTAWDEAFRWLYPTAFAVSRNKLGGMHPGEVEDIALAAIEAVIEKVHSVEEVGELKKLCAAITHNKAVDLIRKLPLPNLPATDDSGDDIPYEPADITTPIDDLDSVELAKLIGDCMSKLQEKCRRLLDAAFIQGLKHKEISSALGMPMGSIGVNISRCLKKLGGIAEISGIRGELRMFLD